MVTLGHFAASLIQDVSVSLGTLGKFGCVGHLSNTGVGALANRDGQRAHAVLPRKRLRRGSTTLDGSRGGGWPWRHRSSSTRFGAARVMQGWVAVPGTALPALAYGMVHVTEVGTIR